MERLAASHGFHRPSRSLLLSALVVLSVGIGGRRSQSWAAVCNTTSSSTTANTFRVESLIDVRALKEAVDCDDGGHVEAVWAGSITLSSEPISIGRGTFLSITGENQQAAVRGHDTCMFDVHEGGSLSLTQLTLSEGTAERGGAIHSLEARLTLDSCVFDGNYASSTATDAVEDGATVSGNGGAVWAQGGEVTIFGGSFSNNSATGFGGGLFASSTNLTIQDGTGFEGNKAVQGGALYGTGLLSCNLNNATFVSNDASYDDAVDVRNNEDAFEAGGAAAFVDTEVEVVISDCLFAWNVAHLYSGGALFGGTDVDLLVDQCTFRNNTARENGGAIAAASATIGGGTELSHNFAGEDGGAVWGWDADGEIAFEQTLCLENEAENNGGCLYGHGNVTLASGTVMRGNVGVSGGCVYMAPESNIKVDGGEYTCKATDNGGFLFAKMAVRATIRDALVVNNVATRRGAGVYCNGERDDLDGAQVTIEGGTFSNNEALEVGGAISAWGKSTVVTISGGTFEGNKAKFYGGFIFLEEEASLSCEGGTINNNSAGDQGGGVYAREATWVNSSCDIIGNESPQGAAAYLTYVRGVTLQNSEISGNLASGGSVVFVAQSPVAARAATFESGVGVLAESANRAIHLDSNSIFLGLDCVFDGWLGDTVVYSENAANGSLVLDSCDFSGSSAVTAVMSPFSDAEIRNAVVSDETLVNVESVDPLQLVDHAVECSDQDACGAIGECVDSALGVLCECLLRNGDISCLDDGGTVSLELQTPASNVTYGPNPVTFELVVSASEDGTTYVIWDLVYEADDLSLAVAPSSGMLRPGRNVTIMVTGTPIREDVGGKMMSRFILTSVGSGSNDGTLDGSATGGMTELQVESVFSLCPAYEYAFPGEDDGEDDNIECEQCSAIQGADGVDCERPGATLASLPVREGYWRSSKESLAIHSCRNSEACVGATEVYSSDDYCAEGYIGPYCVVCTEGYGKGAGSSCHSCKDSISRLLIAAGALFSVMVLVVLILIVVFLIGGQEVVSSVHPSAFLSVFSSSSTARTSIVHSCSGTDFDCGDAAPDPSSPKVTQFSPTFGDMRRAGRSEASTAGAARCMKDTNKKLDVEMPAGSCRIGRSALSGGSTGAAMEHRDDRAADAEEEEEAGCNGTSNSGRFGCCHRFSGKIQKLSSRLPFNKLKILVVVWQILTVFPTIAEVDYPPSYSRFLSWIDVVNLDLGHIFSASCVVPSVTFYESLLMTTMVPIALAGVLVLTYKLAKRRAGIGSRGVVAMRAAWSRHMAAGLMLTFLVFTSASTVVFKTFACDDEAVGGENFLRADYRLSCSSNKHKLFMMYAGIMVLVYPVGIPLLYFFILWTNRHSLNPRIRSRKPELEDEPAWLVRVLPVAEISRTPGEHSTNRTGSGSTQGQTPTTGMSAEAEREMEEELVGKRKQNPKLVPSMFLWKDFGPDLYYYEVVECGRRILLTGVLIFIEPNTPSQAAVACIFAFASLLGFELLRPHLDPVDSWLYRLGCVVIFLSNFLALLIKVDAAGEGKRAALGGLLVAINVCLVLAVLVTSWITTQQQVDDSRDEDIFLTTARAMTTTERLEKQNALTGRRVPKAAGPIPPTSVRSSGLSYTVSVGTTRLVLRDGHESVSSSVLAEPFYSAHETRSSRRRSEPRESSLSRTGGDSRPLPTSGRQAPMGGNAMDDVLPMSRETETCRRWGAGESTFPPSAHPGTSPLSAWPAVERGSVMEETFSSNNTRDNSPLPGRVVRWPLLRQKDQRGINGASFS